MWFACSNVCHCYQNVKLHNTYFQKGMQNVAYNNLFSVVIRLYFPCDAKNKQIPVDTRIRVSQVINRGTTENNT